MKAIVIDRYGTPDVLRLAEVDRPTPGEEQVLVQVKASSVNPFDWHFLTGEPKLFRPAFGGLRKPKHRILGADFAGVVEEVGSAATQFAPGDEVYGLTDGGVYAEYLVANQVTMAPKPEGLTFEEAAAIPLAGVTALQALRDKGTVGSGMKVLINGASGGVGTFAVQIAKDMGAEVTGVCSTRNLDLVGALGAHHVIDYTVEDFTRSDRRYDFILDNVGNRSVTAYRRSLTPRGTYLASHGQPEHRWLGPLWFIARMAAANLLTRRKLTTFVTSQSADDLRYLAEMAETGTLKPVVDRVFPLAEVPDAFRYLEAWHARGKVVVSI